MLMNFFSPNKIKGSFNCCIIINCTVVSYETAATESLKQYPLDIVTPSTAFNGWCIRTFFPDLVNRYTSPLAPAVVVSSSVFNLNIQVIVNLLPVLN